MKNREFKIVTSQSNIDWKGRKVTGAHNGTIDIKKGSFQLKDGKLSGGRFIIDTTSIKILDITDPSTNAQFAGHLASEDFFATEQYTEAEFLVTTAMQTGNDNYNVIGDLTIKGITHPVSFNARLNITENILNAYGRITIDRTLYGIKFRSGNFFKDLGDTLIYNDFELTFQIVAKEVLEPELSSHSLA